MPVSGMRHIVQHLRTTQSRRGDRIMNLTPIGILHRIFGRHDRRLRPVGSASALFAAICLVGATPASAGDAASGRVLAEKWCSGCHLIGGSAAGSDIAPPFAAIAADPEKSRGRLQAWLATPHTAMPSMPLSRRDIDDLISYIESQAP